jgi:methylmalonyl-CoA mutase, C-terminal domain
LSASENKKIRVLVAKAGLDGHDRGVKVIARGLRDAGFEVIYAGLHQTPEMIVAAAVDEDVDVIGVSILSGAHNALMPEIVSGAKKAGLNDVLFMLGGIVPEEDMEGLKNAGVHKVFTPGTSLDEISQFIKANAPKR